MLTNTAGYAGFARGLQARASRTYRGPVKRALDVILVIALLPVALPVCLVVAVVLAFERGPLFFGHTRVGRGGRHFKCWKFRTMKVDAKQLLEALLATDPEARDEWTETRKLTNDPRITRLGAILRKTSLDELPQLWNVLRGDMSLVGPRPVVEEELDLYGPSRRVYLALRPGLTGLWQVSGRNDTSYDDRVNMDVSYFQNFGLRLDLAIMFKTPVVMVRQTGL